MLIWIPVFGEGLEGGLLPVMAGGIDDDLGPLGRDRPGKRRGPGRPPAGQRPHRSAMYASAFLSRVILLPDHESPPARSTVRLGNPNMPKSSILKSARTPAGGTTASVQDYLAAIYDLASKRQAGHRRAPGQAHGDLGAGGHGVHPAAGPGRLRQGRAGQGARSLTEQGPADRRGHGPPSPAPASAGSPTPCGLNWTDAHEEAHRLEHAHLPARRGPAGRAARHADHVSRTATPIPGMAKPPKVVSRFRWRRPGRARPSWSSGSPRKRRRTRICSSISGEQNVRPGRPVKITEVAPWAGTITASGDGQSTTLGLPAATKIWVYLPNDSA